MSDSATRALSRSLLDLCRMRKLKIATAESCTGGLVAAALTEVPGSSAVVDRGFLTYSNRSKIDLVFVSPQTLETAGAVSEETAREMAIGTIRASGAGAAVATTGIAGPGGATPNKPVGLVYIAAAHKDGAVHVTRNQFPGDRTDVRLATVAAALKQLADIIK